MKNTIELAVDSIAGFEIIRYKLERSLINNGKSRRTYKAYAHHVASLCLHFNQLSFDITDEQIADYQTIFSKLTHSKGIVKPILSSLFTACVRAKGLKTAM